MVWRISIVGLDRYRKNDPTVEERLQGIQNRLDCLVQEVGGYFLRISTKGYEPDHFHLKDHLSRFLNPNASTLISSDKVTDFLKIFIAEISDGSRKNPTVEATGHPQLFVTKTYRAQLPNLRCRLAGN